MYYLLKEDATGMYFITDYLEKNIIGRYWIDGRGYCKCTLVGKDKSKEQILSLVQKQEGFPGFEKK